MTISAADFGDFHAGLHGGATPFSWQRRLLDAVLETGCWPERIVAPTGAGKTAVIDVHLFAVALMAAGAGPRVPRRLALVVDRRALVDSQFEIAADIAATLTSAPDGTLLATVDSLLRSLRASREPAALPFDVILLRGGIPPERRWVDDPAAAAVLCATPAMWGSRLLFRGYGTSRRARPREAGVLAYDSVLVVDEAHLARQLVATARQIGVLEGLAAVKLSVPALQVVEATATADGRDIPSSHQIGVTPGDLVSGAPADELLARRLLSPKPVTIVAIPGWPPTSVSARALICERLATEADELLAAYGPTVACVANTVETAVGAARCLREKGCTVELIVGRMRPHDLAKMRARWPGLLSIRGNREVDVLVATQTVEVGLDADFSAMVTELAPGSALAQRAGRVNRLGARSSTELRVLVPNGSIPTKGAPPYEATELQEGLVWLERRAASPDGLAPHAVAEDPPPPAALRRVVLGRPEIHDARLLARTSDRLFAEPDLELWLADDLDPDEDVTVVVRAGLGCGAITDVALLGATPVQAHEGFPAPVGVVRRLVERDLGRDLPTYLLQDDEWMPVDDLARIRPGSTLVVGTAARWFESGVVVAADREKETVNDVLEEMDDPAALRIGRDMPIAALVGSQTATVLLDQLCTVVVEEPVDGRARRSLMAGVLEGVLRQHGLVGDARATDRLRWAVSRLRGRLADAEVTVAPVHQGQAPPWIVIADRRGRPDEDVLRQTWSGVATPLDVHQTDVASRALEIATRVGMDAPIAEALRTAGALHDEGKRDLRFQRLLGHPDPGDASLPALAKSGYRLPAEYRAAQTSCGLPAGWRHEQLSAVTASLSGAGAASLRELVIRLVGTSHGAGRASFPHASASLVGDPGLAPAAAALVAEARRLFDQGAWDSLVESTSRLCGFWGCAYLEALLRAADAQVSREAECGTGDADG